MAVLLVFILCLVSNIKGEKVRGTVNLAESGFAFLGKFCFQYHDMKNFSTTGAASGTIDIQLTNNANTEAKYKLVLYDDQQNSWPKIYNKGLSCEQKLDNKYTRDQRHVTLKNYASYDKTLGIHQHIRPRWWWIYLASCDYYENKNWSKNLSTIDFEIHFRQNTTKWLRIELGSNDQGINIMYCVYLAIYVVLFCVQLYAYYTYTIQQYIHQVIKLLTACIGLQLFAVVFHFADWIIFTETGEHELFFPIIAAFCEIIASSIFLLLLMVLAQGWTVSKFEVVYPHLVLATVVIVAIVESILYIWILIGLDPQSTTFVYNTTPQWLYGVVVIAIGVLFVVQCFISYRNEPLKQKQNLYILLILLFSFWFLWPLLRIIVGDQFTAWSRDVAIQSISLTVNTLTYFIMMLLMWPSWAHQYFNLTMVDTQQQILDSADPQILQQSGASHNYQVLEQDRL